MVTRNNAFSTFYRWYLRNYMYTELDGQISVCWWEKYGLSYDIKISTSLRWVSVVKKWSQHAPLNIYDNTRLELLCNPRVIKCEWLWSTWILWDNMFHVCQHQNNNITKCWDAQYILWNECLLEEDDLVSWLTTHML